MRDRRPATLLRAAAAIAVAVLLDAVSQGEARAADARTGVAEVAVDCPALDAEAKAALESRLQADLIVRDEAGVLDVHCLSGNALVAWRARDYAQRETTVALPTESGGVIERILEATDALLSTPAEAHPPADAPLPDTAVPMPPDAPAPVPATPLPTSTDGPPPSDPVLTRRSADPLALAAGGAFELWQSLPALGPTARAKLVLPAGFALDAGATVLFSLERRLSVAGRLVRLHAGAEYALDAERRFLVGLRGTVDFLRASSDDTEVAIRVVTHTAPGARLHAAYAVPLGDALRLTLGPTLTVHVTPVRVELGAREAFRLPVVAAGLEVQLELGRTNDAPVPSPTPPRAPFPSTATTSPGGAR